MRNILGTAIRKNTIIIGKNSSGKSSFINKIFDSATKGNVAVVDATSTSTNYAVTKISSENIFVENFNGASSTISKYLKDKKATPSSTPALEAELNAVNTALNTSYSSLLKSNIFGTGAEISFESRINSIDHFFDISPKITLNGVEYDISKASSGVKSLVAFVLKEIDSSAATNRILLLDEIDAFLHPSWIELVARVLDVIFANPNLMVVIATHNPILVSKLIKMGYIDDIAKPVWGATPSMVSIEYFDFQSIYAFAENELRSLYAIISPTRVVTRDYSEKYVISMFNQITSRIFFDESVVFVEGTTEEYLLGLMHPSISVISAGGFYNFSIWRKICEVIGIHSKFVMDTDRNNSGAIKPQNDFIYNKLCASNPNCVHRLTDDIEMIIYGYKVNSKDKIFKVIDFCSTASTPFNQSEYNDFVLFTTT